jgi:hypothetical protein
MTLLLRIVLQVLLELLLQTISQRSLFCSFLVFSTGASPVLIKPFLEDYIWEENKKARKPLPMFLIIHQFDCYLPQNTYWYPVKFDNEVQQVEEFSKNRFLGIKVDKSKYISRNAS